ncbi:hypothetical protein Tco_1237762 [Tanacetum coccineum]
MKSCWTTARSYTLKQIEYVTPLGGNPEEDLKDNASLNSGCSGKYDRTRTSLSDFKEFKVSYVEELKFNLYLFHLKSVIKAPIAHQERKNVYSLDLKNIIPSGESLVWFKGNKDKQFYGTEDWRMSLQKISNNTGHLARRLRKELLENLSELLQLGVCSLLKKNRRISIAKEKNMIDRTVQSKVVRALYGLHQAKEHVRKLSSFSLKHGYRRGSTKSSMVKDLKNLKAKGIQEEFHGHNFRFLSEFKISSHSKGSSSTLETTIPRRSTSGGCQYLGRRLVSWQCKKQTIVAISSTEAEYVAAASCCAQVLWMQNQLLDYGFNFMNTEIHIDNESTICIVKNPVFHYQRPKTSCLDFEKVSYVEELKFNLLSVSQI